MERQTVERTRNSFFRISRIPFLEKNDKIYSSYFFGAIPESRRALIFKRFVAFKTSRGANF